MRNVGKMADSLMKACGQECHLQRMAEAARLKEEEKESKTEERGLKAEERGLKAEEARLTAEKERILAYCDDKVTSSLLFLHT